MQYLRDVTAVLQQRSLASGSLVREVPLPGLGSIDVTGRREQSTVLFTYTDMTQPGATYQCAACPGFCPCVSHWQHAHAEPDGTSAKPGHRQPESKIYPRTVRASPCTGNCCDEARCDLPVQAACHPVASCQQISTTCDTACTQTHTHGYIRVRVGLCVPMCTATHHGGAMSTASL